MSLKPAETGQDQLDIFRDKSVKNIASSSAERKLRLMLVFMQTRLPKEKEAQRNFMKWFLVFYAACVGPGVATWMTEGNDETNTHLPRNMGAPVLAERDWPMWVQGLQDRIFLILLDVWRQLPSSTDPHIVSRKLKEALSRTRNTPAIVEYKPGIRRLVVENGQLHYFNVFEDVTTAFELTFVDLLEAVDLSRLLLCSSPQCGKFFLRSKGQKYCSSGCTHGAHPAKARVQKLRERRSQWQAKKVELDQVLAELYESPKLRLLATGQELYQQAKAAFGSAYPRQTGKDFKDGEADLAATERKLGLVPWQRAQKRLERALEQLRKLVRVTRDEAYNDAEIAYQGALKQHEKLEKTGRSAASMAELLVRADGSIKRFRKQIKGF